MVHIMHSLLQAMVLLAQSQVGTMLLLSPAEPVGKPVNVLVFGDSWGAMGPSWRMLDDMFLRHGVVANVKSTAISGTRACQWSKYPDNIINAIDMMFPKKGAEYIWFSLAGNDLLEPDYVECSRGALTFDEAATCAKDLATKVQPCIGALFDRLWEVYPKIKVVQCAYEYQCAEGHCVPFSRWPYCDRNITCANVIGTIWQDALLFPLIDKYTKPEGRYTGININGVLQEANGVPGATMGNPNIYTGAPCSLMLACVHPDYGSAASVAIGEAFWNLYFKNEVLPTGKITIVDTAAPPRMAMPLKDRNEEDISVADTYCNYYWEPQIGGNYVPPPCNRTDYP